MDKVITTIDIYGLGISLLYVLNKTKSLIDPSFEEELRNLFLNMVHFNVMKRDTIHILTEKYKNILKRHITHYKESPLYDHHHITKMIEDKLQSIKMENASNSVSRARLAPIRATVDPIPVCPKNMYYDESTKGCVKTKRRTKPKMTTRRK